MGIIPVLGPSLLVAGEWVGMNKKKSWKKGRCRVPFLGGSERTKGSHTPLGVHPTGAREQGKKINQPKPQQQPTAGRLPGGPFNPSFDIEINFRTEGTP